MTARRVDYRSDKIENWVVTECEQIPGWSWTVFGDAYRRNLDNLRTFVVLFRCGGLDLYPTSHLKAG